MKKNYKHLEVIGTLCCTAALGILCTAVLTIDWVSIQEPQVSELEIDKLGPYEEPKPHLIRAKFGLFKMCIQHIPSSVVASMGMGNLAYTNALNINSGVQENEYRLKIQKLTGKQGPMSSPVECHDLDWYNFGIINFDSSKKPPPMPTELIANCVEKLRFTLPFIGLSLLFTSISFICLLFGHFCQKNKKIIEASMLILGGLCQATALLTFVAQIGSEFEANLPFSHNSSRLTTFYRYKYGYSFYLFLLSFGLSELGAFFDMLAYFRKYPPSHYVITFSRQEPSPFLSTPGGGNGGTSSSGGGGIGNHTTTNSSQNYNTASLGRLANNYHSHHHQHQEHPHHIPSSPQYHYHTQHYNDYHGGVGGHDQMGTLTKNQQHHHLHSCHPGPPDLCNDFSGGGMNVDLTVTRVVPGGIGESMIVDSSGNPLPPPQSYINPEVTITTIERNAGGLYGTLRNSKLPGNGGPATAMESFGTMRKENNI